MITQNNKGFYVLNKNRFDQMSADNQLIPGAFYIVTDEQYVTDETFKSEISKAIQTANTYTDNKFNSFNLIEIVDTPDLPDINISNKNSIYIKIKKSEDQTTTDKYEEYIIKEIDNVRSWEKIGGGSSSVLDPATKVYINDVFSEEVRFDSDPQLQLDNKVDIEIGKGLSSNDFTNDLKNQINTNKSNISTINTNLANKVDKDGSKVLSTNDFTNVYKDQVDANKTNLENHINIKSGNPHNVSLSELADLKDPNSKIPNKYISSSVITDTFLVNTKNDLIKLTLAEKGDVGIVSDLHKSFILQDDPYTNISNWKELLTPDCKVQSVNSQTGTVILSGSDIKTDSGKENTVKVDIENLNANKVDKDGSKVLSDNNFTTVLKDQIGTNKNSIDTINSNLANKVDKVDGKQLSTEDFTTDLKTQIGTNQSEILNITSKSAGSVTKDLQDQINNKVNIESGKGLSSNDFTNELKTQISTNQTDINGLKKDKLNIADANIDLVSDITNTVTSDKCSLNLTKKNLSNKTDSSKEVVIPLASDTKAGIMSPSDVLQIRKNKEDIARLESAGARLLYTTKSNPTSDEINAFAIEKGYSSPFKGISVIVEKTSHIWHFYEGGTGWHDDGIDSVSQFTNDTYGIIKGSTESGKVYAETDGTGSINGWSDLLANVNNKATLEALNTEISNRESADTAINKDLTAIKNKSEGSVTKDLQDQINTKQASGDYATKTELSEGLSGKQNSGDYALNSDLANKVDKITGKGLSSNDFTTELKNQISTNQTDISNIKNKAVGSVTKDLQDQINNKLDSSTHIPDDQVQVDWNSDSGINSIKNKPTDLANKTYVDTKVAGIVDTAPEALNTLNELAAALGDDPNFATTISKEIGTKANKAYVDEQLSTKQVVGDYTTNDQLTTALSNKVDKDGNKVLSDRNFTQILENQINTNQTDIDTLNTNKQDLLKSEGQDQNIKTINGTSILGSGDIEIKVDIPPIKKDLEVAETIDALPSKNLIIGGIFYKMVDDSTPSEWFNINESNAVTLSNTGKTEIAKEPKVAIPQTVKQKTVKGVGNSAFQNCNTLNEAEIPESVNTIEDNAFDGCTNLQKVNIPKQTTNIGANAFNNCAQLTEVNIPESVQTVGANAFNGCNNLTIHKESSGTPAGWDQNWNSSSRPVIEPPPPSPEEWFNLNPNGTLTLSKIGKSEINKPNSVAIIPKTINEQPVTSIGYCAFYDCSGLKSIEIPNSVTSIEAKAFYNCSSLTSVTIPSSVTSIGQDAFYNCTSLTSVTIPSSVISIGDWAFYGCSSLTIYCGAASQPEGWHSEWNYSSRPVIWNVKSLNKNTEFLYALSNDNTIKICKYIGKETIVEIPAQIDEKFVTSIGDKAFYNCTSLTSVTIPSSVTSIGDKAFYNCSSLTSVTIPDNVTSIGTYVFYNCSSLTIYAEAISKLVGWDNNWNPNNRPVVWNFNSFGKNTEYEYISYKDNTIVLNKYIGKKTIVEIPAQIDGKFVTSIGAGAFYNCSSLTSVTIPSSVTNIGNGAFNNCSSLNKVDITDIESWCNISFKDYGSNPLEYAHNLYLNGELITELVIPEGVTSIGRHAFSGCTSLTNVTIPEGITSIGQDAFYNCTSLTSVTIPSSVISIGQWAFYGCSSLIIYCGAASQPEGWHSGWNYSGRPVMWNVKSLNKNTEFLYALSNDNTIKICKYIGKETIVKIPAQIDEFSVTIIEDQAFAGYTSLKNITIPESVTSIGDKAFYNCTSLTSVTIPSSVISIGTYAFYNCSSLPSISIPEGVTTIEYFTFLYCTSLTSINIPSSVTNIVENPFNGCSSLTSITVEAENPIYRSENNCLIEIATNTLILGCKNSIIPNSVTNIGVRAFQNCNELTSIAIPNTITSIGDWAFQRCTSLTSIIIPSSVTNIGNYAFDSCTALANVEIAEGVINIGNHAFDSCTALRRIVIPRGVRSIGMESFLNCEYLISITIPNTVTSIGECAFQNCSSLTIYCEAGVKTDGWNSNWNFNKRPVVWNSTGPAA